MSFKNEGKVMKFQDKQKWRDVSYIIQKRVPQLEMKGHYVVTQTNTKDIKSTGKGNYTGKCKRW